MYQSGPTEDHSQTMKSGTRNPPSGLGHRGRGTTHPVCGLTSRRSKALQDVFQKSFVSGRSSSARFPRSILELFNRVPPQAIPLHLIESRDLPWTAQNQISLAAWACINHPRINLPQPCFLIKRVAPCKEFPTIRQPGAPFPRTQILQNGPRCKGFPPSRTPRAPLTSPVRSTSCLWLWRKRAKHAESPGKDLHND